MQWQQEEIEWLVQLPATAEAQPKIVFYGSSTFTRWVGLAQDFPQVQAMNLGFGGSTLAACAWFFEQVVPRQQPAALLVHAGDNYLGDGRTPEEIVFFLRCGGAGAVLSDAPGAVFRLRKLGRGGGPAAPARKRRLATLLRG
jgi:hypothetical protein